jgi:hypothetical protein
LGGERGSDSQHPGILEGALAKLGGLLLELLEDTLVDTTALVDQVARNRRLAAVDVADHHDVYRQFAPACKPHPQPCNPIISSPLDTSSRLHRTHSSPFITKDAVHSRCLKDTL